MSSLRVQRLQAEKRWMSGLDRNTQAQFCSAGDRRRRAHGAHVCLLSNAEAHGGIST